MAKTEELLKRLVRFHGAEPDMEAVKEYARVIDGYLTDGTKTQERQDYRDRRVYRQVFHYGPRVRRPAGGG